jgi:glycosyltransferase involved in cell wall biosynthesis
VAPEARLLILGDGPLRAELESLAGHLQLDDSVEFLGFRTDAADVMARFHVLAVPSLSDGSPLVVNEAMAGAIPVVATRVGGLPDLVEHGRTGILVDPAAPEQLAQALAALLLDPPAARRMGERARESLLASPHEAMVDQIGSIYAQVLPTAAVLRHPLRQGKSASSSAAFAPPVG